MLEACSLHLCGASCTLAQSGKHWCCADAVLSIGIDMEALPHRLQPQPMNGARCYCEFSAPALAVATGVLDVAGAPPRRRLFAALAACATQELEKERLLHFASSEGRDDLATYCSRERRTLLEVLPFSEPAL